MIFIDPPEHLRMVMDKGFGRRLQKRFGLEWRKS
jgi:hypothetical protein